jgi:hypothetical protein
LLSCEDIIPTRLFGHQFHTSATMAFPNPLLTLISPTKRDVSEPERNTSSFVPFDECDDDDDDLDGMLTSTTFSSSSSLFEGLANFAEKDNHLDEGKRDRSEDDKEVRNEIQSLASSLTSDGISGGLDQVPRKIQSLLQKSEDEEGEDQDAAVFGEMEKETLAFDQTLADDEVKKGTSTRATKVPSNSGTLPYPEKSPEWTCRVVRVIAATSLSTQNKSKQFRRKEKKKKNFFH